MDKIEAAKSLLERAKKEQICSKAYLLIDSAHSLDATIDTASIKREWLNQWMENQYKQMKGQS